MIALLFGSFLIELFLPVLLWLVIENAQGFALSTLTLILVKLVFITDPIMILNNADAKEACWKPKSEAWSFYNRIFGGNF